MGMIQNPQIMRTVNIWNSFNRMAQLPSKAQPGKAMKVKEERIEANIEMPTAQPGIFLCPRK